MPAIKRSLIALLRQILAKEADSKLRISVQKMIRMIRHMDDDGDNSDLITAMKTHTNKIKSIDLKKRMQTLTKELEEINRSSSSSSEAEFTDVSSLSASDHDEGSPLKYQMKRITGMRISRQDERLYRVHWDGFDDSEDDTWEPMDKLIQDGCGEFIAQFHGKIRKMV